MTITPGALPLERQAGVDIGGLRRQHPRMCFVGHFNKMTMDPRGGGARRVRAYREYAHEASRQSVVLAASEPAPREEGRRDGPELS